MWNALRRDTILASNDVSRCVASSLSRVIRRLQTFQKLVYGPTADRLAVGRAENTQVKSEARNSKSEALAV